MQRKAHTYVEKFKRMHAAESLVCVTKQRPCYWMAFFSHFRHRGESSVQRRRAAAARTACLHAIMFVYIDLVLLYYRTSRGCRLSKHAYTLLECATVCSVPSQEGRSLRLIKQSELAFQTRVLCRLNMSFYHAASRNYRNTAKQGAIPVGQYVRWHYSDKQCVLCVK